MENLITHTSNLIAIISLFGYLPAELPADALPLLGAFFLSSFGDDKVLVDDKLSSAFEVYMRFCNVRNASYYILMSNEVTILQITLKAVIATFDKVFHFNSVHNKACFCGVCSPLLN